MSRMKTMLVLSVVLAAVGCGSSVQKAGSATSGQGGTGSSSAGNTGVGGSGASGTSGQGGSVSGTTGAGGNPAGTSGVGGGFVGTTGVGGSAAGTGGGSTTAACTIDGGSLTWTADGVNQVAGVVETTCTTDGAFAGIEVVGGESSGIGIAILLEAQGTVVGTYDCGSTATNQDVIFTYTGDSGAGGGGTATPVSCTVTVANAGTPGGVKAKGTFSAVLSLSGGGTTTITNGVFDVPVCTPK